MARGPNGTGVTCEVNSEQVTLAYPLGAIFILQQKLGCGIEMEKIFAVLEELNVQTLPTFIWAGRLHEVRDLDFEKYVTELSWSNEVNVLALYHAITAAYRSALTGEVPDDLDEEKEEVTEENPKRSRGLRRFTSIFRRRTADTKNSGGESHGLVLLTDSARFGRETRKLA